MSKELYRKHRPKDFSEVLGQPHAVKILSSFIKKDRLPHFLLFSGPSGTGKTTLARILRSKLKCGSADFQEINAANSRGIDMVRDVQSKMNLSPLSGEVKIWLIDEAHKLSADAQNAFLKILEDTPTHVYFIFATTDAGKLIKTILTRCTEIRLREIAESDLGILIDTVAKKEGIKITKAITDRIVECSFGSARTALVLLNKLGQVDGGEEEKLETIDAVAENKEAILLARALLNPSTKFPDLIPILKQVGTEDPESVRWMILSYMTNCALSGNRGIMDRALFVMDKFQFDYFNSKKAGLILSCNACCSVR